MKKIHVVISWCGDNYAASTADVNGAVIATGKTLDKVKNEFESALEFHIEGSIEDGDELPDFVKAGKYEFVYINTVV